MEEQVNIFFLIYFSSPKFFYFWLNQIRISKDFQNLIQQLIDQHKKVYQEIEDLYNRDHQSANLTRRLTHTVEILV